MVSGVLIGGLLGYGLSHHYYYGRHYGYTPGGSPFYGYCVPASLFGPQVSNKAGLGNATGSSNSSSSNSTAGSSSTGSGSRSSTPSQYPPCTLYSNSNATSGSNSSSSGGASSLPVCPAGSLCFAPQQGRNRLGDPSVTGRCVPSARCDPTAWDPDALYYDDSSPAPRSARVGSLLGAVAAAVAVGMAL